MNTVMGSRGIRSVAARAVPLRGDDIDTDRIMPARYLRCVSFEGLEQHVFEDDRKLTGAGRHPFDDPRYRGAGILLVNRNFGCGSSREHAPQALQRWGIGAIIGESFAEIFFGNCVALGIPCLTAARDGIEKLMRLAETEPAREITADVDRLEIITPSFSVPAQLPAGPRDAFLRGAWDATGTLLADYLEVEAVARSLPYIAGF